jgi:hypothetical protein
VSLAAPAADYYPEHLMLMAAEGPPLATAAVALLPSAAVAGANNIKVPPPDYSEEGESSPKISSLDPTAAAAAVPITVGNSLGDQQLDQQRQQRPRTSAAAIEHTGAARSRTGNRGLASGGSGRRPEVPSPFQDAPPPSSSEHDLPLTHEGGGGRKRTQRQTNTVKSFADFFYNIIPLDARFLELFHFFASFK